MAGRYSGKMSEESAKLVKFPSRLLGPDDPPPCEVVNPDSPSRMLFVCDHASTAIPRAMGNLGVDAGILSRHVAWDIGAGDVARRLARRFDATLVLAGYSRLLIDPNRGLDDPTSIVAVSDGVVIPGNRAVTADQAAARAEAAFAPYHGAVAASLEAREARGFTPALISIHSFTPVFKGFERPWQVGILWNKDPRIAGPLMAALADDPAITVGDNQPYSARDNFGHTVENHAEPQGRPHVLMEIRQDLIDTHHGAEAWAGRVGAALERALDDDPDLYRKEVY